MSVVHVDTEQQSGAGTVIADPDGSGFHIQLPEATIEVNQSQLLGITQAASALLGVASTNVRPAFLGDSNMVERPGVAAAQTFPAVMAAAMGATEFGVFAAGGENSSHGINRVPSVLGFDPTHVFIDYGVNDADTAQGISAVQYESNMRVIIAGLLARGIKVILLSPILISMNGYIERQRDQYIPAWRRLNGIPGVTYVDIFSQMGARVVLEAGSAGMNALYNGSDTMHWGVSGNLWRRDRCKEAMGI